MLELMFGDWATCHDLCEHPLLGLVGEAPPAGVHDGLVEEEGGACPGHPQETLHRRVGARGSADQEPHSWILPGAVPFTGFLIFSREIQFFTITIKLLPNRIPGLTVQPRRSFGQQKGCNKQQTSGRQSPRM